MKKRKQIDAERVAKALRAEHRGFVSAHGGYFGAAQLAADIQSRLRTPASGGRRTDPAWTTKRLVPMTEATLHSLERIAASSSQSVKREVAPLQVAAVLLERAASQLEKDPSGEHRDAHAPLPNMDCFPSLTRRNQLAAAEKVAATIRERHCVFAL